MEGKKQSIDGSACGDCFFPSLLCEMSMIFGRIGVETPKYTCLKQCVEYEVRRYPASIQATVETQGASLVDGAGFRDLAGYIFGGNKRRDDSGNSQKIAMTAPVLTESNSTTNVKIAMTAPVLTESDTKSVKMAFVLPAEYTSLDQLPTPTNPRVHLKEIPSMVMAVHTFSGSASDAQVTTKTEEMRAWLSRDGVVLAEDAKPVLARYNPPWTLWFLRTNEIMLRVSWID
jgi:hypothetical protein